MLRAIYIRSLLRLTLGNGLGVECFADRKHYLGRICRIRRHLPLWNHKHLDGEVWGETRRSLHNEADTAYQYRGT